MTEEVRLAIVAERERIAAWHEKQAAELDAAAERILSEGGDIIVTHKALVELHRRAAAAIREGALE